MLVRRAAICLSAFSFLLGVLGGTPVAAQDAGATLAAKIVDSGSSLPIPNAQVRLQQGDSNIATGTTGDNGTFRFTVPSAGVFSISVSAIGYRTERSTDVRVLSGTDISVRILAVQATVNESGPTEIGRVVSAARANTQIASTVSRNLSPEAVQRQSFLRAGDALATLPGITPIGLESSPGDDLFLSIRGMRSSEAATTLDGNPIGPLGVSNGARGAYDYQLSPFFALKNVQVTYGSGGSNVYGLDAIAGLVDFQTIDPTVGRPSVKLTQSLGNLGRDATSVNLTGSTGDLGYAFASGVSGTYGSFAPQQIANTGNLAGNDTSANVAANTWVVSQNFNQRQSLGKLVYQFSPTTSLGLSFYEASLYDDKTGNGGIGYAQPDYVAYNASLHAIPTAGCPSGLTVKTDANPALCVTAAQYGAMNSGPTGGSPVTWQTLAEHNYSIRSQTSAGPVTIVADLFRDNEGVIYDRIATGFTYNYLSNGFRASADYVNKNGTNSLGAGALSEQQAFTQVNFSPAAIAGTPTVNSGVQTFFLRDTYSPIKQLTIYANANLKTEHPTDHQFFEPRLAVTYNINAADSLRIAGGRASEQAQASLVTGSPSFITTPGRLNVACGGLTSVVSGPNANLTGETGTDLEIGYGHRFAPGASMNVTAYYEEEQNAIFSALLPLSMSPYQPTAAVLQASLARVQQVCNFTPTVANLGYTTSVNAGAGRFRGIDVTGHLQVGRFGSVDAAYDVTSSRIFNIPILALQNNLTTVDGGQVGGIPYQSATLSLAYSPPAGLQARIASYFMGANNPISHPPFAYENLSVGYQFKRTLLNVGIYNAFNTASSPYSVPGAGVFLPENQFGRDATPLQQAISGYNSLGAIAPRAVVFSLEQRF